MKRIEIGIWFFGAALLFLPVISGCDKPAEPLPAAPPGKVRSGGGERKPESAEQPGGGERKPERAEQPGGGERKPERPKSSGGGERTGGGTPGSAGTADGSAPGGTGVPGGRGASSRGLSERLIERNSTERRTLSEDRKILWNKTIRDVRKLIRHPRCTFAEFGVARTGIEPLADDTYQVTGVVVVEDSEGREFCRRYSCRVRYRNGGFSLLEARFAEVDSL